VEIDPQWPMTLGGAVELAAGEAYPGRHAERVTKEALLVVERERGEAAVTCRFTPEQAVSDGLADVARGVALTDLELDGVFHRLVRDLNLTIPAAAVGREVLVARARSLLGRATANAALMLGSDGVPEDEVRAWLAETSLMDARFVDQALREISTLPGRIAAFGHMAGPRVIAEWLEVQGQTHGLTRLLAEQLTPWRMSLEIQAPAG
ncbi:MAG: hypothetical protein M3P32_03650, partial [Chloroflexota bacterium]|nr:hypothetical protein [Chloroflexota bacterium]